jgi:surfactin synthase thioesterase subunit
MQTFESFRIDQEDEHRDSINKLISQVAKEAYNKGVGDCQVAVLGLSDAGTVSEETAEVVERAICAKFVK